MYFFFLSFFKYILIIDIPTKIIIFVEHQVNDTHPPLNSKSHSKNYNCYSSDALYLCFSVIFLSHSTSSPFLAPWRFFLFTFRKVKRKDYEYPNLFSLLFYSANFVSSSSSRSMQPHSLTQDYVQAKQTTRRQAIFPPSSSVSFQVLGTHPFAASLGTSASNAGLTSGLSPLAWPLICWRSSPMVSSSWHSSLLLNWEEGSSSCKCMYMLVDLVDINS